MDPGIFLRGVAAFAVTVIIHKLFRPLASRLGLVDYPTSRKDHAAPVPVTGGIAMLVGILLAMATFEQELGAATLGFILAAGILIGLGILDDRFDVSWRLRIAAQVVAALVMIVVGGIRIEQLGYLFGHQVLYLGIFSVPLTVFVTVGIINAVNMIDGADGLAGLIVLAAFVMLEAAAVYSGNEAVYSRVPILIGAVAGFLVDNVRTPRRDRARAFMGNSGSAFLGLAIACFIFRLTQNPAHPVSAVLTIWFLPLPVMDCLVLIMHRLSKLRSPFRADHDHIHHLMMEAGFGPTQAAFALTMFSCMTGFAAALYMRAHYPQWLLPAAFIAMCLAWYWLTSRRNRAVGLFSVLHRFAVQPVRRAMVWPLNYVRSMSLDADKDSRRRSA